MTTYSPKASEINRAWHVIDAEGLVLGRMCTEAARVLRGKHKPTFAPHIDTGDHVVIINASKVVLTKNKAALKGVYRHTGYPGGIKSETYANLLDRDAADWRGRRDFEFVDRHCAFARFGRCHISQRLEGREEADPGSTRS